MNKIILFAFTFISAASVAEVEDCSNKYDKLLRDSTELMPKHLVSSAIFNIDGLDLLNVGLEDQIKERFPELSVETYLLDSTQVCLQVKNTYFIVGSSWFGGYYLRTEIAPRCSKCIEVDSSILPEGPNGIELGDTMSSVSMKLGIDIKTRTQRLEYQNELSQPNEHGRTYNWQFIDLHFVGDALKQIRVQNSWE